MRFIRRLAGGLVILAISGSAFPQAPGKSTIQAHMTFLADDLLEGRAAGTRGFDLAALYVATQFQQYGLAPKGDNGSYLQKVALRSSQLASEAPVLEISGSQGSQRLVYGEDFAAAGSLLEDQSTVAAPLVFAGYGIESSRFHRDDYAGLDVRGKVVVLLEGKPSSLPSEEGAHLGSMRTKAALAARNGAIGIILLPTPVSEKVLPFPKWVEYLRTPSMVWLDHTGKPANELAVTQNRMVLSMAGTRKLFASTDIKLDQLFALADANQPLPRIDLQQSARMAKTSVRAAAASNNVVGLIEGSDPRLKHEYVVMSAHLDHLGQDRAKVGDKIFNGAMDNAAGVATMLETARMFGQANARPKRSILFVALTGEEKGLLGSDFFARNPTVPRGSIVANVNMDMPLLTYDFSNVMAFGAEHSAILKSTVARVLDQLGLGLIADPWPEQAVFVRTDHYSFVKQGIPSLTISPGMGSFDKREDPAKLWGEFLHTRYHQPSDDLSQPINYTAAARLARINFMIASDIANAGARPAWNQGDFFGDTFRK